MKCHRYTTANSGGIGEGETLSFQTEPGKEYYVKVTNKISVYDYKLEDLLSNPTGYSRGERTSSISSSISCESCRKSHSS